MHNLGSALEINASGCRVRGCCSAQVSPKFLRRWNSLSDTETLAWRFVPQEVAKNYKCFSQSSFNSHVPNLMEKLNVTKAKTSGGTNFYGSPEVLQYTKKDHSCATTFDVDISEAEAAELVYLEQFDLFSSWLITNLRVRSFDKFVAIRTSLHSSRYWLLMFPSHLFLASSRSHIIPNATRSRFKQIQHEFDVGNFEDQFHNSRYVHNQPEVAVAVMPHFVSILLWLPEKNFRIWRYDKKSKPSKQFPAHNCANCAHLCTSGPLFILSICGTEAYIKTPQTPRFPYSGYSGYSGCFWFLEIRRP